MDDVTTNVIDLRARVARLRGQAIAEDAAAAIAELEGLRTSLRNLNLVMQLHDLVGKPLTDEDDIHRILDEIAQELAECMRILNLPHG